MDLSGWRIASIRPVRAFTGEDQGTATALKAAYESLPTPSAAAWSAGRGPRRRRRPRQQPPRSDPAQHRLPPPRQGRRAHRLARLALARPLARGAPRIHRRRSPPGVREEPELAAAPRGLARHLQRVVRRPRQAPGPLPLRPNHLLLPGPEQGEDQAVAQAGRQQGRQRTRLYQPPVAARPPSSAAPPSPACTSAPLSSPTPQPFPKPLPFPTSSRSFSTWKTNASFVVMKDRDLAFLLNRSPVLEVLTIIASQTDVLLCLVSHSLRCLQLGMSSVGDVAVANAPRLERLLLWMTQRCRTGGNKFSRIKIDKVPNLNMLGYWHPGQRELQIGDTVIEAGTKVSPSTIIPSVKIVALDLNFDICNDVKTMPAFIKCFPNIETLHIKISQLGSPVSSFGRRLALLNVSARQTLGYPRVPGEEK